MRRTSVHLVMEKPSVSWRSSYEQLNKFNIALRTDDLQQMMHWADSFTAVDAMNVADMTHNGQSLSRIFIASGVCRRLAGERMPSVTSFDIAAGSTPSFSEPCAHDPCNVRHRIVVQMSTINRSLPTLAQFDRASVTLRHADDDEYVLGCMAHMSSTELVDANWIWLFKMIRKYYAHLVQQRTFEVICPDDHKVSLVNSLVHYHSLHHSLLLLLPLSAYRLYTDVGRNLNECVACLSVVNKGRGTK